MATPGRPARCRHTCSAPRPGPGGAPTRRPRGTHCLQCHSAGGQRGQRVLRGGRQGPPRGQWSPDGCSTLDEPRRLAVFHQYKSLAMCTCVRAHYIARKQSVKNSLSVEVPAGWNDLPREPGLLQAVLPPRSARGWASGHPQGRAHLACAERPPRLCRLEKALARGCSTAPACLLHVVTVDRDGLASSRLHRPSCSTAVRAVAVEP